MCCGSSVWSGMQTLEAQHALRDLGGTEMKSELQRIGFLGQEKCSYIDMPLMAHFELHIEQVLILEKEGKKIGIVGGVQAMRWYKAAKLIIAVNTLAISHGAVGTVGIVKTTIEAVNTIVGTAWFKYD